MTDCFVAWLGKETKNKNQKKKTKKKTQKTKKKHAKRMINILQWTVK